MKEKTKDNLIYLGVAGVIVAAMTFYIFYTDRTMGRIPEIPGPILWGIVSTPGIVALIFERFWEHRRRPVLWVVSSIAALINISAMVVAFSFQWNLPVIVWSTLTVLLLIVVFIGANRLLARDR